MRNPAMLVILLFGSSMVLGPIGVLASGPVPQAPIPAQAGPGQKSPGASLGIFPYPKNNQTPAQQLQDETQCYGWARQQTGIDPAAPPPPPQEPKKIQGAGVKGAASGAAAGTAVGAAAGDAGKGAAVGATAGAIRARRQQRMANKQAEKQADAAAKQKQQQTLDVFKKAFGGCMDGRGYSVK